MRKLLFVLFLCSTVLFANSQNLTVEGSAPNLYITHTVAPKENFYSVGRLYNQAPKSIASFNNITMEKGLTIGQHIKIPLNTQNLDASGNANIGETLIPLTHIVDKSETLFKIGNNFNASVESLRKWNNLSSDNIIPGTALIVGNLKIGGEQTAAAAITAATNVTTATAPVTQPNAPGRKEATAVKEATPEPIKEEQVIMAQTSTTPQKTEPAPAATTPTVNQNSNSTTPAEAVKEAPVAAANSTPAMDKKETPAVAVQQAAKPAETVIAPVKQAEATSYANDNKRTSSIDLGSLSEGAFAGNFPADASSRSLKNKSGEAATFKSTSGWQDKKYYVLMNDVVPGTILKITSADNKFVYAKVLGSMPEMKENNGILLRVSNSAASHLGIIDPKFPVQVSYYQ